MKLRFWKTEERGGQSKNKRRDAPSRPIYVLCFPDEREGKTGQRLLRDGSETIDRSRSIWIHGNAELLFFLQRV